MKSENMKRWFELAKLFSAKSCEVCDFIQILNFVVSNLIMIPISSKKIFSVIYKEVNIFKVLK
jgi:hypothetical protein